ncbi:MAG: cyclic nucleotide-binding domain-containing protein [Candidatus Scalindua sp.]|nr:cyclic nucleotide-binding domain-containing protein [Candidatus Scalindua sp.]MBT6046707.1 cyclic nucleotide-binding domain-containing protein [Candidatus Scalindua sp.]MBT6231733.1 cyclic nucleotide-binding domain-containing protein [Candidatus Scalindua sp.]
MKAKTCRFYQVLRFFKGLTEDDLKKIQVNCQRQRFKEGDILLKEGQVNSDFYIIINGQVEVCLPEQNVEIKSKRPTKVKLAIENEGDFFDEYSLIDSKPASASVIAKQAGELIKITKYGLEKFWKTTIVLRRRFI